MQTKIEQAAPSVYLLSLGCSKNQVDSEGMRGVLSAQGLPLTDDAEEATVIIVNTCGFILPAKEESIQSLLDLAHYKEEGSCRLLVAVGCLVEKYQRELAEALPEVDLFLGSRQYGEIARLISEALGLEQRQNWQEDRLYLERQRIGPAHTAYLKIAEGCDKHCTYCLIPQLRGAYRSRPQAEILAEARALAAQGVRELILLAQDTTHYGLDTEGRALLPELLEELAQLPFTWIRLLYAYPEGVDARLLQTMAAHTNICNYLDLPLQHVDDAVLQTMGRQVTGQALREKVALIRQYLPDIALRTTMMVGFPGETEQAFETLLAFVRELGFDWLGGFAYSREEDTPAYGLPAQIAEDVKQERLDLLLQQAALSTAERLSGRVRETLTVLAEEPAEDYAPGWWAGRSQYQAPEVDGLVYFPGFAGLQAGQLGRVKITAADVYDLEGEWEENL